MLSREEGKTRPERIAEVTRAGNIFKFLAGKCLRLRVGRMMSVRPSLDVEITREPLGVDDIIALWNFAIANPAWNIAPALAYGNCRHEAGRAGARQHLGADRDPWPRRPAAGRVQPGDGAGAMVGAALLNGCRVNAISFTGSVATGNKVGMAPIGRMAKVHIEMGDKYPLWSSTTPTSQAPSPARCGARTFR